MVMGLPLAKMLGVTTIVSNAASSGKVLKLIVWLLLVLEQQLE